MSICYDKFHDIWQIIPDIIEHFKNEDTSFGCIAITAFLKIILRTSDINCTYIGCYCLWYGIMIKRTSNIMANWCGLGAWAPWASTTVALASSGHPRPPGPPANWGWVTGVQLNCIRLDPAHGRDAAQVVSWLADSGSGHLSCLFAKCPSWGTKLPLTLPLAMGLESESDQYSPCWPSSSNLNSQLWAVKFTVSR